VRISKFTETQIAQILREAQEGAAVADVARRHNISAATLYQWRSKYGGISIVEMQRLRELKLENSRLKHLYADLTEDHAVLKEAFSKKF